MKNLSSIKGGNFLLPGFVLLILLIGYQLVGKNSHITDFFLKNIPADLNFYKYIGIGIAMLAASFFLLNKKAVEFDTAKLPMKSLLISLVVFALIFIVERIFMYRFWINLRVEHEQELWLHAAHHWVNYWENNPFKPWQFSFWYGHYNSPFMYLLVAINKLVYVDSWFEYQMVSYVLFMLSILLLALLVNHIYGKAATFFLLLITLTSAYAHFVSYYLKHHIIIIMSFVLLMFAIFKMWEKFSYTRVLLVSVACFWAFISYIGCIYYLPVALFAVLFNKTSNTVKAVSLLIVALPTTTHLYYLMHHLEAWPSSYFLAKAVWNHDIVAIGEHTTSTGRVSFLEGLPTFLYNLHTQVKLLFVPGGIWGWMLQGCFIVGLLYTCSTFKKDTFIWLVALGASIAAMSSSRDAELAHNFIVLGPYLMIAVFGADQLWKRHFSINKLSRIIGVSLLTIGLVTESYYFSLSQRWMNFQVWDQITNLNGRVWHFDDAKKLQSHYKNDYALVIDSSLVDNFPNWADTDLIGNFDYAGLFSELSIFKKANFMKKTDKFPAACHTTLLTDKNLESAQLFLGEKAEVTLLEKYRPANPRYEYLNYQPEVIHYIYDVKMADKCKGGIQGL